MRKGSTKKKMAKSKKKKSGNPPEGMGGKNTFRPGQVGKSLPVQFTSAAASTSEARQKS